MKGLKLRSYIRYTIMSSYKRRERVPVTESPRGTFRIVTIGISRSMSRPIENANLGQLEEKRYLVIDRILVSSLFRY